VTGGPEQVVDVHVHAAPRQLADEVSRGTFPGVAVEFADGTPRFRFPDMAASPWLPDAILDVAEIAGWASGKAVDVQLVGPWTDLFGYTLPPGEAADWSRRYNEVLVDACRQHHSTLPIGTIPMAAPAAAVAELEAAKELGCRGVMIGTDIPGLHLGSPELDPVWEVAAALRMPVLLHPTHLHLPDDLHGAGLKNAVGRAGPTAVALARLIYGGALVRYPGLAVIASHGGGAFAAVAPRIVRNHELGWSESNYDPQESIARLYFDSVVLDSGYLQYLVRSFGVDRFLLGSDFPFPWEVDPVGTVTGTTLTRDEQRAVLGGNAARLFDLSGHRAR
jgi:aminocarboxymuconate-semialdehyde decarboxylase